MTTEAIPPAEAKIGQIDVRERNKRYVQIDAIGVGIAIAAAPFLPVFLTRLGASPLQVGLLTSMPGFTGFFLSLWVGRFLQQQRNVVPWFSLARLLVISAFSLTGLIAFFIPDQYLVPAVLLIWALVTLPQTMEAVGFSVVMNAVSGPEGRYDLMSRRWSILGLTNAITIALAGQVLNRIGFHINYQLVFIVLSLGGLISYYCTSRIRIPDNEPLQVSPATPIQTRLREYFLLFKHEPAFVSISLKRFIYFFGITLATPLFPLYFVRQLNASDAWISLLYTSQTMVLVAGYFFWTRQSRRMGTRFVLLISTLSFALYPGLVALTTSQPLIFFYGTLVGIFQAGIDLVFFDELMKTIPPRYSPTFVAFAQSLQYLASILAPLIGTYLSMHIGLSAALLISAGVRLVGFVLFSQKGQQKPQITPITSL